MAKAITEHGNTYDATILEDSVSPQGVRLTTWSLCFPRFLLAELNTHCMLSRNSASSRAIPPEDQIERVLTYPFIPLTFNKRVKGMGVGEALQTVEQKRAEAAWLEARDAAVKSAEALMTLDCDKSRINRLLEPFLWHTAIVTATEWSNYFALRAHPGAQPEFQTIAHMMKDLYAANTPVEIKAGWWHTPMVTPEEKAELAQHHVSAEKVGDLTARAERQAAVTALFEMNARVSAGRCARVSFDTHENWEVAGDSYARAKKLEASGHMSPFEHPARPLTEMDSDFLINGRYDRPDPADPSRSPRMADMLANTFVGKLRGWVPLRATIPHEADFSRILEEQA